MITSTTTWHPTLNLEQISATQLALREMTQKLIREALICQRLGCTITRDSFLRLAKQSGSAYVACRTARLCLVNPS